MCGFPSQFVVVVRFLRRPPVGIRVVFLRPLGRKRGVRDDLGEHGVDVRHVDGGILVAFQRKHVREGEGQRQREQEIR